MTRLSVSVGLGVTGADRLLTPRSVAGVNGRSGSLPRVPVRKRQYPRPGVAEIAALITQVPFTRATC